MDARPPAGRRYFVRVSAPSPNAMGELSRRGLDLFAGTAAVTEDGSAVIDGTPTRTAPTSPSAPSSTAPAP